MPNIASVLQDGLSRNFGQVEVSVVDCPNLTQEPFGLACEGLGGHPRLADIGGVPNLVPLAQKKKVIFDLSKVPEWTELPDAFMLGAGAGPRHVEGIN
uniref:DUF1907 domain-containing protein n=1 Tax=Capitella teleta TaxID=283909 RepID=X2BCX1_CAPTE